MDEWIDGWMDTPGNTSCLLMTISTNHHDDER